ncbi:MAG: RICIN domain-containing protein [Acidobacteriaceae bacterium]|nr:RICIN domain-containing protein [Acidobacteriaceae bacterium]
MRFRKCVSALPLSALIAASAFCQTNVLTFHNDNARTGQNVTETILTPANVQPSTFGKRFVVPVDGKVDAQPLYVASVNVPGRGSRSVVYAATEHDSVYAFDANSGTIYWQVSLLGSGETTSDARNCNQVVPEIGITGTPVINLNAGPNGTIYTVAMSKDAAGNYHHRIHALDLTTGNEQSGSPVEVTATYPGTGANSSNGTVVFDPKQYKSRPGLTLSNGIVYTAWGSHCDIGAYTGWLLGYDENTLAQVRVFNLAPNGSEAALWGSGGGVDVDGSGTIFLDVANGTFDTTLTSDGFPRNQDFGNAFVKLDPSTGAMRVLDYWTMNNTVSESSRDQDLGSGGLVLLPDLTDANGQVRHLATGAGKDANVYVFDRDNMGKFDASNNGTLYEEIPAGLGGSEFASPAWFNGAVYYGAVGDRIRAFPVNNAQLSSQPSSVTANAFAFPGATPSVSANGSQNAILWAVENSNPAVLHAYDPNNLATEFYNSNQASGGRDQFGPGNKFIVPTIVDGKVIVGTTNSVVVFGPLGRGPIPDGDYTLQNAFSGMVLDDPGFSNRPGTQPIQWPANGGSNQHWHFASQAGGAYTIQNDSNGLFLTYPGGLYYNGVALEQQPATNDASQLWTLTASGSAYVIHNVAGNVVIDDPGFSQRQGQGIILWIANSGANQSWLIR